MSDVVNVFDAIANAGCGAYPLPDGRIAIKFPNGLAVAVKDAVVLPAWQTQRLEEQLVRELTPAAVAIATMMQGSSGGKHSSKERLSYEESRHQRDMEAVQRPARRKVSIGSDTDDIPELLPGYEPIGATAQDPDMSMVVDV